MAGPLLLLRRVQSQIMGIPVSIRSRPLGRRPACGVLRTSPIAQGTIYTCPMHPQIRRGDPGSCPICGMALEREGIPEAEGTSPELKDMTRRFLIGAVLAAPIFVLEMGGHLPVLNLDHYVSMAASKWIQLALGNAHRAVVRVAFFSASLDVVPEPIAQHVHFDCLRVGASYLYSLVATFAPGLFPEGLRQHGLIPVYYEAAAVVTVLVLLGQVLELRAREKTGGAIRALLKLAPRRRGASGGMGRMRKCRLTKSMLGDRLRCGPACSSRGWAVTEGASAIENRW